MRKDATGRLPATTDQCMVLRTAAHQNRVGYGWLSCARDQQGLIWAPWKRRQQDKSHQRATSGAMLSMLYKTLHWRRQWWGIVYSNTGWGPAGRQRARRISSDVPSEPSSRHHQQRQCHSCRDSSACIDHTLPQVCKNSVPAGMPQCRVHDHPGSAARPRRLTTRQHTRPRPMPQPAAAAARQCCCVEAGAATHHSARQRALGRAGATTPTTTAKTTTHKAPPLKSSGLNHKSPSHSHLANTSALFSSDATTW